MHTSAYPVQQRLAPALPVSIKRTRHVSPFEVEFRGADQGHVQTAARTYANGIDAYRSPAVSVTRLDGSEWVTTLRFYSAD